MIRVDHLYAIAAPLLLGSTTYKGFSAAAEATLADHPAWLPLAPASRRRFLDALWRDLRSQHDYRRWLDAGHPSDAPWVEVVGRIRQGIAVVMCPACAEGHGHAPVAAKRYAPCGRVRYTISLMTDTHPQQAPAEIELL